MKSKTNKTNYDDKLFYQAIISSLDQLIANPAKEELKALEHSVQISHSKPFHVFATAPGTISIKDNEIRILHENNISSVYTNVVPSADLINGQKINQNEEIGQCIKDCEIRIEINPTFLIKEK
ncbi:MAG: M23 family metallopeptidase [Bacilli bacterium]|nr:M23 family metallopeptidase [Bacilli bacterium]